MFKTSRTRFLPALSAAQGAEQEMHQHQPPYVLATSTLYCNYCPGYCCYRLEGATLYLDASDINRIARHFTITDGEVRKRYMEGKNTFKVRTDGSCVFLRTDRMCRRCGIHEARPRQCRDFPYSSPCPYLEREELLAEIQPRVEQSLRDGQGDRRAYRMVETDETVPDPTPGSGAGGGAMPPDF